MILLISMNKTILVFLHYQGSWSTDTKEEIFKEGEIIWAGYKPVQIGHDDGVEWDEIVVVECPNEDLYNDILENLAEDVRLKTYQVLLIKPIRPEQIEQMNAIFKKGQDDSSVDFTPGAEIDEVYSGIDIEKWKKLFNGDYQDDIVVMNMNYFRDIPKYPDDYKGKRKKTTKEAYMVYQFSAMPAMGKSGVLMDMAGRVLDVIVSVRDVKYNSFAFPHYPSVQAFRSVFTATSRLDSLVHQQAALDMEHGDGYAVRPYKKF